MTVLPSARARPLFEQLPELLRGLEQQGMPLLLGSSSSPDPLTALACQLRMVTARQGPTAHPGSIYLMIKQPLDQMGGDEVRAERGVLRHPHRPRTPQAFLTVHLGELSGGV